MLKKIDPFLQQLVHICGKEKSLNCLVYSNNIHYLNKYFSFHKLCDVVAVYPFINAIGIKVFQDNIYKVADLNIVTYITANTKVSCLVQHSKEVLKLNTPMLVQSDFTCAIIDTGVSPTLDLCVPKNRIVYFKDFINHKTIPYDDNGHGTFVTSVLAGNGLVSGGEISGIVPNLKFISLKALNSEGETDAFTILDAMEWVYKNHKKYNIKVVCMSFGSSVLSENDPLIMGAEALGDSGITVVVAAGNSGPAPQTIKSPGASPKLITVGAMKDDRTNTPYDIASFSSRGPILENYKPDIIAPGVEIKAGCSFQLNKKHYSLMSGTSVSTPMIAGIVCYITSLNSNLNPNMIKRFLMNNCIEISGNRNFEGSGYFNGESLQELIK